MKFAGTSVHAQSYVLTKISGLALFIMDALTSSLRCDTKKSF